MIQGHLNVECSCVFPDRGNNNAQGSEDSSAKKVEIPGSEHLETEIRQRKRAGTKI